MWDVQGLKNRLDMVYVRQDRIQSTLAGSVPPSRIFRSPSIDAAVVTCPSPYFPQLSSPPLYVTPKPKFNFQPVMAYPQPVYTPSVSATSVDRSVLTQSMPRQMHTPAHSAPELDLESRISLDDLESFLSLDCNLLATAGDTLTIIKTETPGTPLPSGDPHQPTISPLSYPATSTPNVLDRQYQPATSTHNVLDHPFATSSILGHAFATASILDRPIVPSRVSQVASLHGVR